MNKLIRAIAITAALAAPIASFAQSNSGVTRTEVKDQLIQLERAGYEPSTGSDLHYPNNLQHAERRAGMLNSNGYSSAGGLADGSSRSGAAVQDGYAAAPAAAH